MRTVLALTAAAAALFAAPAFADTIYFGQFGPEFALLGNPVDGVTTGGVDFTMTGPAGSDWNVFENNSLGEWPGNFHTNTTVLYDGGVAGTLTIDFATPISSITGLSYADNNIGPFSVTMDAFNSSHVLLGSITLAGNEQILSGAAPVFNFFDAGISELTFTSTDDSNGFAVASTPEPATWALMLAGFAGLGAALRSRRKLATA